MNELMGLDQLERMAKNPTYKMSKEQLDRLEELRMERYVTRKHPFGPVKHDTSIVKHNPTIEDPGVSDEPSRPN